MRDPSTSAAVRWTDLRNFLDSELAFEKDAEALTMDWLLTERGYTRHPVTGEWEPPVT